MAEKIVLNSYIDHSLLKADSVKDDVDKFIKEAVDYGFATVCVNPYYVKYAKSKLMDSEVKVSTVVGFPLGQSTAETKAFATKNSVENGADEVDVVMNIAALKNGDDDYVYRELKSIREVDENVVLKVMLETTLLTDDEIARAVKIASKADFDFVDTSTGFIPGGASVRVINIIKENIEGNLKIKASGGIRDAERAKLMIETGADRIASRESVVIVEGLKFNSDG